VSLFFQKLYVRIWLAVVLAVAVLTLLVGWAWRMTAEPPLREVVVRNAAGAIIGNGQARLGRGPDGSGWQPRGRPPERAAPGAGAATDGKGDTNSDNHDEEHEPVHSKYGNGPEFTVRMVDGQTMHLHLPRPPNAAWRAPFGFFWTLGLVAVAVALAIYPIVRRLTHRLEALQRNVERWGNGDLSVRMPTGGRDEVGFLASGFNKAAEQIETLVKTREDLLTSQKSLLANASHELRSPLTRIRMGLELMGHAAGSTAKNEISRNIGELDQLIDEILLASRLDAQEANLGTVEPVELVGLAAEECARTQATLDVEVSVVLVPGVAKLLRRVVRNLLENTRRYAGGEATLSIRTDAGFAVIQVRDKGPGVPAALSERIFEPFYRLPGASEREGGVGLGLALVKSITLRHGGTVQCSNRPEGGACFEVRLPLQA
jgi:signal transduction histidine kinase